MVDEKKLKKVIKEGGKRGVEIDGAATMGGLQFFCTKVDEPEGDIDLLVKCVEAMNAEVDENEEERKGGSGAVGKMIFSCDNNKLCIVAYVPKEFTPKGDQQPMDAMAWLDHILKPFDGKNLGGDKHLAKGVIDANPDAGKFTLKMRDEALTNSIAYLRSKKVFPEQESDSDDDIVYGDDFDFDAV